MKSRKQHLHALAELVDRNDDVERRRDEYLASLDADDGLIVLVIPADEIRSAAATRRARAPARCDRCGARLPAKPHRCGRCGLARR